MTVTHEFGPVVYPNSKVLILGSMPSVKSREYGFYYMHPQNRFWWVISKVFGEDIPKTILLKKEFIKKHDLALWDVIKSCDIKGSSDSSISNVKVNDIMGLVNRYNILTIFITGKKAFSLFNKYFKDTDIQVFCLPSTSPANRRISDLDLIEQYKQIELCVKKSK